MPIFSADTLGFAVAIQANIKTGNSVKVKKK